MLGQIVRCMCGLLLLCGVAQAAVVDGKDYKRLASPQPVQDPSRQEVIEFFWYGCAHCYALDAKVAQWEATLPKDVNFRRVHILWDGSYRPATEGHARLYITLSTMGILKKYHKAAFDAVQKQGVELRKEGPLFNWVKSQGIDLAKFKAVYNSFSMNLELSKLQKMTNDYGVSGVPAFVVNGKYMTSPSIVNSEEKNFAVINELLANERKTAKPAVPEAKPGKASVPAKK